VGGQVIGVTLSRRSQQGGPAIGSQAVIQPGLVDLGIELGRRALLRHRRPRDQHDPDQQRQ